MIAIKRFSLLYNLDIKQIDLNLTYIQKKNLFQAFLNKTNNQFDCNHSNTCFWIVLIYRWKQKVERVGH
jgi:hypothetical protein